MNTLQQTISWAKTYIQYSPITAGFGQEPAVSVASMIRSTLMNAPITWYWNRAETTFSTVKGTQDYVENIPDFGFIENVSLLDTNGKIWQIKDVYNTASLSPSTDQQRPEAMSVEGVGLIAGAALTITNIAITSHVLTVTVASGATGLSVGQSVKLTGLTTATFLNGQTVQVSTIPGNTSFTASYTHVDYGTAADGGSATPQTTGILFRFLGVPNAVYQVTVVYQKKPQSFGPFLISAAANHVGATTTYTGLFDPLSFPAGSTASITGFVTNIVNNGSFSVVSCSATSLVVLNGAGVAETIAAFVSDFDWAPIPDTFGDVYNNLFLSEMLANVDDAKSQVYRQRGVAAFLAKSTGLTETQRNAFIQQWLARSVESNTTMMSAQTGNQARGV
jgi:hypothetical protein